MPVMRDPPSGQHAWHIEDENIYMLATKLTIQRQFVYSDHQQRTKFVPINSNSARFRAGYYYLFDGYPAVRFHVPSFRTLSQIPCCTWTKCPDWFSYDHATLSPSCANVRHCCTWICRCLVNEPCQLHRLDACCPFLFCCFDDSSGST